MPSTSRDSACARTSFLYFKKGSKLVPPTQGHQLLDLSNPAVLKGVDFETGTAVAVFQQQSQLSAMPQ
jgi:hypothetical protein